MVHTLHLYISASSGTTRKRPFLACAPALGFPYSELFRQRVVHTQQLLRMSFQTLRTSFRLELFMLFSLSLRVFILIFTNALLLSGSLWMPAVFLISGFLTLGSLSILPFFCTTVFLALEQVPAIAFLAANIALFVTLEITVRSKRSGKFLFKAYMLVIVSFHIRTTERSIQLITVGAGSNPRMKV